MTPQTLTTEDDYNNAPVGTVVIDPKGIAWQKCTELNLIQTGKQTTWRATIADPNEVTITHNTNKMTEHSPHTVVYTPPQAEPAEPRKPPQREYTTDADLEELNNAPIGTFVKDKDGDSWVKTHRGWAFITESHTNLHVANAPYTLIHLPSDLANL